MPTTTLRLCVFFSLLAVHGPVVAADWPRFRGPNGTGIAADKGVPIQWSEKENIRWKTPIPGQGHSSPIVSKGKIFLQSASEDGKQRMLLCLNAEDGKILWTATETGTTAKMNLSNTLASSTPAADGERVYALFWDGAKMFLHAYDYQGKALWQYPLGNFTSQHGAGHSPAVYGGRVFINYDQDDSAAVVAINARDGKLAWQTPRKAFRASYSTPFMLDEAGNAPQLLVASTAGLTGYNPADGKEIWHWTWNFGKEKPLRTVGSPIFGDGMIFCGSGDGGGARHMVAVKAGGKGDVSKTALVWENTRTLPYVPGMLYHDGHVYFTNDRGMAGCAVAKTGKIIWTERLGDPAIASSPVLIDGKVYAINEEGTAFIFPAAPEYKLLAKNSIGEPTRSSPAVADNCLYIRGKKHLFCIGKK